MNPTDLYNDLLRELTEVRPYLADKPEETPEGALRALWFLASGERRAVERCLEGELPVLSPASTEHLHTLVREHIQGTPLAHLTGRQCFMGIEMLAGPEALIPRKETELLGYAALGNLQEIDGHATVIDLCTGCGNLVLALAYHAPACRVYAADLAPEAIDLAQRNAAFLGLEDRVAFFTGDLFTPFDDAPLLGTVDLVVCNPPYISSRRVGEMAPEVSDHEPRLAFDGGPFGVSVLVRLIAEAPRYLRPGGRLCFEVGLGQGELVRRRIERSGAYDEIEARADAEGNVRALVARVMERASE